MTTNRRVNVTFTIVTDEDPGDVMYSAMTVIRDEAALEIETVSVHAFTLDDDPEAAK